METKRKKTEMLGIIIREGTPFDIEEMTLLLEELFTVEEDFSCDRKKQRDGLRLMLDNGETRCVMVAELNCQVIGMCTVQVLISTAEGGEVGLIEDMVVKKAYRGKGIGTALLWAIEKWAHNRGLLRLQLLADRDNFTALAFYKKLQWAPTQLICLRRKA